MSTMTATPNHALQRTAAGRRGCNRRVSWPPSLSLSRYAAAATRISSTYDEFRCSLEPQASVLAAVHRSFVAPPHVPHPAWHDADVRADGPVVHPVHDADLFAYRLLRVSGNCAWHDGWCSSYVAGVGPDRVALHRVNRLGHLLMGGAPAAGCCITKHCTGPGPQRCL